MSSRRGEVVVRPATAADVAALAELRWTWRAGERGEAGPSRQEFVERFAAWVAEHLDSHVPFVAMVDHSLVGMAFLAIVTRVPGVQSWARRSGYLQSVYVLPGHRGAGIGGQLIERIVAEARQRQLEYLAVHPTPRSMTLYRHRGFTESGELLELRL